MAEFPLRNGEAWALWLFALSGVTGFGSFLAYLGYGYLDTWHGIGTVLLLPCFLVGLYRSFTRLATRATPKVLLTPAVPGKWLSQYGFGRACLLAVAAGMIGGGATITMVGMTRVFVPQDLQFLGLTPSELSSLNPHLVPLIAHDRAGFGGGVGTCGIILMFLIWCGRPCRSLWQVLLIAGTVGFGSAIAVHPVIGYTNFFHLAPALIGFALFVAGVTLLKKPMFDRAAPETNATKPNQPVRTTAEAV